MFPFISIIIPALNEEEYIDKCLQSIKDLDYPKNRYEVILVDNGSTDKTIEIAKKFKVKVIKKCGLTIGTLRNIGGRYAKGQILAFTESDCIIEKNWLKYAVSDFEDDRDLMVVGYHSLLPHNAFWLERLWNKLTSVFNKKVVYLSGRNFVIKRDLFEKVNGFDERLITGEDPELCYRLYNRGYFLKYDPRLKVIHFGYPKNIFEFVYKKVWYTLGYPYLFKKYGLKTKMGIKFMILLLIIIFLVVFLIYYISIRI